MEFFRATVHLVTSIPCQMWLHAVIPLSNLHLITRRQFCRNYFRNQEQKFHWHMVKTRAFPRSRCFHFPSGEQLTILRIVAGIDQQTGENSKGKHVNWNIYLAAAAKAGSSTRGRETDSCTLLEVIAVRNELRSSFAPASWQETRFLIVSERG